MINLKLKSYMLRDEGGEGADRQVSVRLLACHRESGSTMIRFFLVYNTKGITRLSKFYVPSPDKEKKEIIKQLYELTSSRDPKQPRYFPFHGNTQILYRRYQQLIFCMCIEAGDNVLAHLEAIHLFVTVLNTYFNPVSELDMMYNFHKVYSILDEVLLAGEVMETSKTVVMKELALMDK